MYQDDLYIKYLNQSNIPLLYYEDISLDIPTSDIDAFHRLKNIQDDIINFVKEGYNLFLYSPNTGNGKTTVVCKLCKQYLKSYACNFDIEQPVYFINLAEYLLSKKSAMDDKSNHIWEIENKIKSARVVIWDDIAVKGLSEFDNEQFYNLLNYRISNKKSNMFTSNNTPFMLEKCLDARIYSRIVNNSINIGFYGSDKRYLNVAKY